MSSKHGICKLTGKQGKYVKSHIIPKALFPREQPGQKLVETDGHSISFRPDTFYDRELVTQDGENILRDLDDWAIKELERLKLIWRGWKTDSFTEEGMPFDRNGAIGHRALKSSDARRLRLFFLSLLWRAAASYRREMNNVAMPEADLERIRRMLVEGQAEPFYQFPIILAHYWSKGIDYSMAPFEVSSSQSEGLSRLNSWRFYFNGLFCHIMRDAKTVIDEMRWGKLVVGRIAEFSVLILDWDGSSQAGELFKGFSAFANHSAIKR